MEKFENFVNIDSKKTTEKPLTEFGYFNEFASEAGNVKGDKKDTRAGAAEPDSELSDSSFTSESDVETDDIFAPDLDGESLGLSFTESDGEVSEASAAESEVGFAELLATKDAGAHRLFLEGKDVEEMSDCEIIDIVTKGECTQEQLRVILNIRGTDIDEGLLGEIILHAKLPLLQLIMDNPEYRDMIDYGVIVQNQNLNGDLIAKILGTGLSQDELLTLVCNPAVPADILENIYLNPDYPKNFGILGKMAIHPNANETLLAALLEDVSMGRHQTVDIPVSDKYILLESIASNPKAGERNLLKVLDIAHGLNAVGGCLLSVAQNPSATPEVFDKLLKDKSFEKAYCEGTFKAISNHPNATRANKILVGQRRGAVMGGAYVGA